MRSCRKEVDRCEQAKKQADAEAETPSALPVSIIYDTQAKQAPASSVGSDPMASA